jgi:hypothetical protein
MLDDQATTTELPDGGVAVEFTDGTKKGAGLDGKLALPEAGGPQHFANLADALDESALTRIGQDALQKIDDEEKSREPWLSMQAKALTLLGLTDIDTSSNDYDDKLPDGAQTTASLLLTSVQKWIGNASREMSYVDGPIAAQHIEPKKGEPAPEDRDECVERVERFFNRYIKTRLPGWYSDMDRTLMNTARSGSSFKKVYADPQGAMPICVEQIDPQNLIVPANAKALYGGTPITHHIPKMPKHDALRLMEQAFYRDSSLTGTNLPGSDPITDKSQAIAGLTVTTLEGEDTVGVYERHCWLTLDADPHPRKLARPYILTILEDGGFVLRLQRNWLPDDQNERCYQSFTGYQFQPGDNAVYAIGLGQMLYAIVLAMKAGLNAALAAAWLANHPGGFKSADFSIRASSTKARLGEFQDIESAMGDISKGIMAFPFKGPDPALIQLLEKLDGDGRELAGILTMNVAEAANSNTPPGTVLAALDEASVIPASSHVRMFLAFEAELRMMLDAARRVWGSSYFELEPGFCLEAGDLDRVLLIPRMRPGAFSRQRRIAEAQAVLANSKEFPQQHDTRAALRRFYEALGTENIDEIMPPEEETQPSDIVTEGKNALAGKALKAGLTQDHQSHIAGHTAQVQLYASRKELGEAGMAAASSLQSHIGEHLASDMAVRVASVMGIPLEQFAKGLPPEVEMHIAPMVAQAVEMVAKLLAGGEEGSTPEEIALQIEQIRTKSAEKREAMKGQVAITTTAMKIGQDKEGQRAETARAIADNMMAYQIHRTPSADGAAKAEVMANAKTGNPGAGAKAKALPRPPGSG